MNGTEQKTDVLAVLIIIRVFDFVKVVFVELTDETGEIGVLEHPREDGLGELVHVLDDEAVALGPPRYDMREGSVLEHPDGRSFRPRAQKQARNVSTHL